MKTELANVKLNRDKPFFLGSICIDPKEMRKNVKPGKESKELIKNLLVAIEQGVFSRS